MLLSLLLLMTQGSIRFYKCSWLAFTRQCEYNLSRAGGQAPSHQCFVIAEPGYISVPEFAQQIWNKIQDRMGHHGSEARLGDVLVSVC